MLIRPHSGEILPVPAAGVCAILRNTKKIMSDKSVIKNGRTTVVVEMAVV